MTDFLHLQWQGQLHEAVTAITTTTASWAASSAAGEVVCWQNGELTYYQTAGECSIDCLQYSADGKYLAAAGQAGQVTIWYEGTLWQTIVAPRVWIDRLAWHPSLPILAVAIGKQVQIWQVADRELLATLPFNRSTVSDLCWKFDGSQIAIAGYGGVAVWNWADWQQYEMLAVATSAHCLAWSQDGQFLAAATIDRQLVIAASQELERPWIIADLPAKIRQLQWFAATPTLAMVSNQELVCWQYAEENWHPQAAALSAPPTISMAAHPQLPLLAVLVSSDQDTNAPENVILLQDPDLATLGKVIIEQTILEKNISGQALLQWSKAGTGLVLGCSSGDISWWLVQL